MVIISFDMTKVTPLKRQTLTKNLVGSGWIKINKAKTTFRYSKKNPIKAIIGFMDLIKRLKLQKGITMLVVQMVRG